MTACRHHDEDETCADCELAPVVHLPKQPRQWIAEIRDRYLHGTNGNGHHHSDGGDE